MASHCATGVALFFSRRRRSIFVGLLRFPAPPFLFSFTNILGPRPSVIAILRCSRCARRSIAAGGTRRGARAFSLPPALCVDIKSQDKCETEYQESFLHDFHLLPSWKIL